MCVLCTRLGIFDTGFKCYFKRILILFKKNFWIKVDVNDDSVNKMNLVFKQKFVYYILYRTIYITGPDFLFYCKKKITQNLTEQQFVQLKIPNKFLLLAKFSMCKVR